MAATGRRRRGARPAVAIAALMGALLVPPAVAHAQTTPHTLASSVLLTTADLPGFTVTPSSTSTPFGVASSVEQCDPAAGGAVAALTQTTSDSAPGKTLVSGTAYAGGETRISSAAWDPQSTAAARAGFASLTTPAFRACVDSAASAAAQGFGSTYASTFTQLPSPGVGDQSDAWQENVTLSGGLTAHGYATTVVIRVGTMVAIVAFTVSAFGAATGASFYPTAQVTLLASLVASRMKEAVASSAPTTTTTTTPGIQVGCAVATWSQRLGASKALKSISMPEPSAATPASLSLSVTESASIASFTVCQANVTTFLAAGSSFLNPFAAGAITIGAKWSSGSVLNVFSLVAAAWTKHGTGPGPFKLQKPLTWTESVNGPRVMSPLLQLSPQKTADLTLSIGSITARFAVLRAQLIKHGSRALTVALGPAVTLSVNAQAKLFRRQVQQDEAEGMDPTTAAKDVADEVAGEGAAAEEEVAAQQFGSDVRAVARSFASDADVALTDAIEAAPEVIDPPPEDPVPAEWGDAGGASTDVAAVDAAAEDGGADLLFAIFFL